MTPSLLESFREYDRLRGLNPQLSDLSRRDFTGEWLASTGDPRAERVRDAGLAKAAFTRGVQGLDYVTESASNIARELFGGGDSLAPRAAAATTQMGISSVPHLLIGALTGALASRMRPFYALGPAASGAFEYAREKVSGSTDYESTGAGIGTALSVGLGMAGGQKARKHYIRKAANPTARGAGIAGAAGGAAGSAAGDLVEIATMDESKGPLENIKTFFSDPANVIAYTAVQGGLGATFDYAHHKGELAAQNRDKYLRELMLESVSSNPSTYERLLEIQRKPLATRSAQEVTEEKNLIETIRLKQDAEAERFLNRALESFETVPEPKPVLLRQLALVKAGKKPAMMVDNPLALSEETTAPLSKLSYKGKHFYFNEKEVSEASIKEAVDTDSIGLVLGYGIPRADATTKDVISLRTAKNQEILSVVAPKSDNQAVLNALRKMLGPANTIEFTTIQKIVADRLKGSSVKRYSLSNALAPIDIYERPSQETPHGTLDIIELVEGDSSLAKGYEVGETLFVHEGVDSKTGSMHLVHHALESGKGSVAVPPSSPFRKAMQRITLSQPERTVLTKNNVPVEVDLFTLDNLHKDFDEMFRRYAVDEQPSFEAAFQEERAAFDKSLRDGKLLTTEEFLREAQRQQPIDTSALFKYLNSIAPDKGYFRSVNVEPIKGVQVFGANRNGEIYVNFANRSPAQAFGTLVHELTHSSTDAWRLMNPKEFEASREWIASMTPDERLAILQELAEGVSDIDLAYGSGKHFSGENATVDTLYEFVATIAEIDARRTFDNLSLPKYYANLNWLPFNILRMIHSGLKFALSFFSPYKPSVARTLSKEWQEKTEKAVEIMRKAIGKREVEDQLAAQKLQVLKAFDPEHFALHGEDFNKLFSEVRLSGAFKEMANTIFEETGRAKDSVKETVKRASDIYEENFLPSLFRAQVTPALMPVFKILRSFRTNVKEQSHAFLAYLGQNNDNTLSIKDALIRADEFITELTKPTKERDLRLRKMGRIFEQDQITRERFHNLHKTVKPEDLVSAEDMVKKYGLSERDAHFTVRLRELPSLALRQMIFNQEQADAAHLATAFTKLNKSVPIETFENIANEVTHLSDRIGRFATIVDDYRRLLRVIERAEGRKSEKYEAVLAAYKRGQSDYQVRELQLNQTMRSKLGEFIDVTTEESTELLSSLTSLIISQAKYRTELSLLLHDPGYMPMTRRGRFILRVLSDDSLEREAGFVKETRGFASRRELEKYVKEQKLGEDDIEIIDKDDVKQRMKLFFPKSFEVASEKAKEELNKLLQKMREKVETEETSPQKQAILETIEAVAREFRPYMDELREIISVKGDKYMQRRRLISGYDILDFVPNAFEYVNSMTVASVKKLTRARAELYMSRKEFDDDPNLRARTSAEINYVLNQTHEGEATRKFIFNWYLGASVRHFMQSVVQVPLNGISQMVDRNNSFLKTHRLWFDGMRLASKYAFDGRTGDKLLDKLLTEAEFKGVTIPNNIEWFSPDTTRLQHSIDNLNRYGTGAARLGERASYEISRISTLLGRVMRSTAVAAEVANRRISFVMGYLNEKSQGVTDADTLFKKASEFTDLANFVGEKSNRPGVLVKHGFDAMGQPSQIHRPLMILLALQSFVINHVGQLYSFAKKGFWRKDPASRKAFYTGVAYLLLFSGALGSLGAELMEQVFEKITGISVRYAIRKKLVALSDTLFGDGTLGDQATDAILYGLPGLLGIDASQSLGLGNPILTYQSSRTMTAFDVLGPIGGLLERGWEAGKVVGEELKRVVNGHPLAPTELWRAARIASPQAFNYWVRLLEAGATGQYLDRKLQPVADLSEASIASLVTGFYPMEVAKKREVEKLNIQNAKRLSQDLEYTTRRTAMHLKEFYESNDEKHLQMARRVAHRFLETTYGQDPGSFVSSVVNQLNAFYEPSLQEPSLKEVPGFEAIKESFPSVKYPFSSRSGAALSELEVALQLGLPEVLLSKLDRFVESFQRKLLADLLIQGGFAPPIASRLTTGQVGQIRPVLGVPPLLL